MGLFLGFHTFMGVLFAVITVQEGRLWSGKSARRSQDTMARFKTVSEIAWARPEDLVNKTKNTTRIAGYKSLTIQVSTGGRSCYSMYALLVSRLIAILLERRLAGGPHASRADGSCFVAEPHSALLARLATLLGAPAYPEPGSVSLSTAGGFDAQPRSVVRCWMDAWSRYTVREEGAG